VPYKNTAVTVCYLAWDAVNNVGKTGDGANHTIRGVGDGTEFTPAAPNVTEIDSTNCKGLYKATFAAGENNYSCVTLHGKSSTAGISIIPRHWFNETNADVEQWNAHAVVAPNVNGIPLVDLKYTLGTLSAGVAGYVGIDWSHVNAPTTTVGLTGTTIATTQQVDVNTIKTQTVTCGAGVTVGAFVGNATAALSVDASGRIDLGKILGTASAGAAGYVGVDWAHINAPTTTVDLTGTTIKNLDGNTVQTGDAYIRAGTIITTLGAPVTTIAGDIAEVEGETDSIIASLAGVVTANVTQWAGTNVAATNTAGVPVVDTREIMRVNTAQATGNSTTTIKLDAGASASDNFYVNYSIQIISGTGAPEAGVCVGYVGSTKIATIYPAWPTAPDNTSVFLIRPVQVDTVAWLGAGIATPDVGGYPKISALDSQSMHNGLAQAGGTSTITLAASESGPDSYYRFTRIRIWQGAGIGQARNIIGYVNATKVATVDRPWVIAVDSTSRYSIESADEPLLDANGYVTVKGVHPQKNVALPNFEFVMVDARGVGIPLLAITVTRSKDGGAYAAADNAPTEVGGGTYVINLTANDLNAGVVTFHFTASGAADKWITMVTQS